MNIYIGNLAPEVTEEELKQGFTAFGEVTSVSGMVRKKDKVAVTPLGFFLAFRTALYSQCDSATIICRT